jgi:hypothetical protein
MSGTTLDAINAQLAAAIYVAAGLGAGLAILAVGVGMLVMARAQTDSARAAGRRVILVGAVLTPVLLISRMLPGWFGLPDPDLPSAVTSTVTWGVGLGLVVATVGIGTLAATSLGDAGAAVGARRQRERAR